MTSSDTARVDKITAPYGSWKSPITAEVVSSAGKRLEGIAVAGDGRLVWIETRPDEGGRAVLVKEPIKPEDEPLEIIPPDFAARTLALDYGGGAFAVSKDMVIFSNFEDQRLYKQSIGVRLLISNPSISFRFGNEANYIVPSLNCILTGGIYIDLRPVPLTPDYDGPVVCYADGVFDHYFKRYITIMEDRRQSSRKPTMSIAAIESKDGEIQEPKELVVGNDFYAFPRIDITGKRMAWIEWSHPNMPWDRAELWVGYFSENGDLCERVCVAGGDLKLVESPTEPKWSPKGELFFVNDRENGFWNIYKWIEPKNEIVPVYSLDAEFTRPMWGFGISSYDFIENNEKDHNILASYRKNGRSYLGILDNSESTFSVLDIPFTDIDNIVVGCGCLYIEAASGSHPLSIAKVTLNESHSKAKEVSIIWCSSPEITKYKSNISLPEIIEFPTVVPGENAYAYFYPPANPSYRASLHEKPPLLVESHGGPTCEARGILNLNIQYWTSRGWAFLDVNYGGSTGYGRKYRERLLGKWGIVDVNDCCSCAEILVAGGKVDGKRLCITGESAGGYTALACLAFRDTFKAGASLYGIADLSLLKAEIPKFESHYIDNLVGDGNAFFQRSPFNFVDEFTCPVILFQGLDDKIVPPGQASKIYKALKDKGLPVALVQYEGEQHGFRKAENIKFTIEQQMMFFARTVGQFQPADPISPIKIDNLD